MNMGKYFSIEELSLSAVSKRRGIDNTPHTEAAKNLELLIEDLLDPVREAWGAPIIVNSGYRCEELNRVIGGAVNSQHLRGEAADITTGNRADNKRLFDKIGISGMEFDQLIDEKDYSWVHISYSAGRNRRQILHLK